MELTASVLAAPAAATATANPRVLVVLPSLGTSVSALWQSAATHLGGVDPETTVIGIDLPGHGRSTPVDVPAGTSEVPRLTMSDLAEAVLTTIDRVLPDVAGSAARISLAGDSIGGAIALQLALDHGDRFDRAAVFCTGAKIGEASGWEERAEVVATSGTPTQVIGSAQRWFGEGFMDREPDASAALLHSLQDADRFSYAALCHALASFDIRSRLSEIALPVLAVAGSEDQPTPPTKLAEISNGISGALLEVIEGAAHLVPAEAPAVVASLLHDFLDGNNTGGNSANTQSSDAASAELPTASGPREASRDEVRVAGMTVRRQVLSDAHVDRANVKVDDFTADFQDLITRYAWGEIWTRPGLEKRMRSAITLTAMIAGGHEAELAMHVKAAVRNGLSRDEIKEVLLQSAIYCSVPSANTAFSVASQALAEMDEEG
ncbi:bifunctional 3-oxoadipate enol-lactonase/4-carboxymuconolactone decarboxylase PcaDC [Brevibacterium sp. UCMA 11754]|uniref:bifunctional 3-oxoadipate enol-lactonase/4-carboxymuconolactone decarboxylase PcaDC n=1 Tax=Brevibacterium sp. UCMA 11754 TaxID=2749198 RepID=UPI003FA42EF6|nr:4-carboxymuconolactone decarboxylase [Brevibacterium sp. UCMA 11754]